MIYLDYNATTPVADEVLREMEPFLAAQFGNPSSIHAAGRAARAGIDDARDRLAALLRAKPHELIFTGSGTESDNLAVIGLARAHAGKGKHLITAATEHHAVLHPFEHLEKREGFRVTVLRVDSSGCVDLDELRSAITDGTALVSIMAANNETGVLQPVEEIGAICRERGVLFHTDAIQGFGKMQIDAGSLPVDALSLAGHKFYGPKGVGLLYLRAGVAIERIQFGGSHENERRPGTENTAAIVGMAGAAELAAREIDAERTRQGTLRERLWEGVRAAFPDAIRNGDPARCLANTLNVSFPGLDGELLLINLDLEGVCASSGSACMVGSIQPSHVLIAMGVPPGIAQATVRFSLGKYTDAAEIDAASEALTRVASRLRTGRGL